MSRGSALRIGTVFGILATAIFLAAQQPAEATITLNITDGVTVVQCADGDANSALCPGGDVAGAPGAVTFSGAIGNWLVSVTTAVTYPTLGSQTSAILDLNTVNVTSSAGGALTIKASEINYQAPASPTNTGFQFKVGGTTAGSVNYQAWATDANTLFGTGTSLGSIAFATSPFAGVFTGSALLSGAYSLTIQAGIVHAGSGATSFDAELRLVPEAAALSMFGLALALLGMTGAHRKKVAA